MAIVKMKKLQLMVVRSQKDSLLDELTRLGCVQISEMDEIPGGLRSESAAVTEVKTEQTAFNAALKILDKFAPAKSKLLAPKPEISEESFMSNEGYEDELEAAEEIIRLEQKLRSISGEESRLRAVIESLTPWTALDMPLQTAETKYAAVFLGTLPAEADPAMAEAALEEKAPEAEVFVVSSDEEQHYVALISSKAMQEEALDALREFGFAQTSISNTSGTAKENIADAEKELENLAKSKADTEAEIVEAASHRNAIRLCADRAETAINRAEAENRFAGTESVVCFTGWLEAPEEERFAESMEGFDCAWETCDPVEEEYPDVPVKLKNNKITNALNMVTNMYALPTYDGVDPNPLMAPFFILFFGLMMADMGYGALMVIAAIVAIKKIKPKEGTLSFCQLLLYTGIATFVCGALTGGLFGNSLEVVGQILGKPEGWGVLPALFNPMDQCMEVLIGAMILGIIHLNTGMAVNAVEKCKRGEYADAFWEEGVLWITLIGGILMGVGALTKNPSTVGKIILFAGLAGVFYGGSRGSEGIGKKILSVFVTLYNQATGWFGDILSYARIMALMLAGSVIGMVFNTIGGIANSLWLFIPIFLVGHALNFGLNLLGCYVHDLRLQCLEYFGKFYKDGGKPFKPVTVKSKFYDVVKE